ncbi:hypothetical protein MBLNU459_g6163t1 [Dothideomycetes sp. NU459]
MPTTSQPASQTDVQAILVARLHLHLHLHQPSADTAPPLSDPPPSLTPSASVSIASSPSRLQPATMPMPDSATEEAKQGVLQSLRAFGESSVPPTLLATLVTAQHFRPFQKLPMLFPPVLLFSSYLNLSGYPTDSAGITSAWSAAYLVVARRRKHPFAHKFGARGIVRGATMGLCLANIAACGMAYVFGKREDADE